MYLSRLEIVGFKSFAQKTVLKFTDGLTGIVGPNGCGKTNIVDAIRWVLGEQKTSVLRSEVMENVIFNGTNARKPLGMAEVALTLHNNKNLLPTEYTDVTVARRLFRSGESAYLLNNTHCRLKDIIDLFMDTGMGSDSYSVIELKMVEAILNGKPEERRHLVEEAAGVTKYKLRRKEASRKLASVQGDLLRVQDIVVEVEKNVNSLGRQAAKTRRYNKLLAQFKELELCLFKHEYTKLKKDEDIFSGELNQMLVAKQQQEEELGVSEEAIQAIENDHHRLNSEYQKIREKENSLNSLSAQKTKEIAVSEEKINSIKYSQERIKKEIEDSKGSSERITLSISQSTTRLEELRKEKEQAVENFVNQKELRDEAKRNVTSLREDTSSANEEVLNIQNQINTIKASLNKNRNRKIALEQRLDDNDSQIEKLRSSMEELDSSNELSLNKREELKKNLKDKENELQSSQERQIALQKEIEEYQNVILKNRQELGHKSASLEFLSGLIDSNETSKFLINSKEWQPSAEKTLLIEAVAADDEFRVAVEAALGDAARYFVVNTKEEAGSAINLLKAKDKGKATFICMDSIPEMPAPGAIPQDDGLFGWLSEFVRVDDKLRNVLRAISGKTALVNDYGKANEVIDKGIADYAVTLQGEIISKAGTVRGGAVSKTEGQTVGKKERIDKLQKEISKLKEKIAGLEEKMSDSKKEYAAIDIRKLTDAVRRAETEINANEQKITQLKYKKESLENNLSLIEQNSGRFSEEIAEIENEDSKLDSEKDDLDNSLLLAREEMQAQMSGLHNAESELAQLEQAARTAEMKTIKIDADINGIVKDLDSYDRQKSSLTNRVENLAREQVQNESLKTELEEKVVILKKELGEIEEQILLVLSELEFHSEQLKNLEEQLQQYTDDLSKKRRTYDRAVEAIHQKELKISEFRSAINNILERARENLETDIETAEIEINPNFSIADTKKELTDIKEKLNALGSVNFMALEEFETQNQRLQFYREQMKDLTESEKSLQDAIREINQTAEDRFNKTFEEVKKNFENIFKSLFGAEAEAELILAEGNPLEADIDIMAKPAGKKPHSIEMLSGGEKTLTAISLLFAIYLVKPSPFCILDEVDAPLDDANIDKFLNIIREFSKNTQFLIVTHNKRTMEACDNLYGITMQEEGVSKVVSVRLAEGIS